MFSLWEIEKITKEFFGGDPSYSELRCLCFDDKSDEKRLKTIIELMAINKAIQGSLND